MAALAPEPDALRGLRVNLVTPYDLSVAGGVNSHAAGLGRELQRRGAAVTLIGPASNPRRLPQGLRVVPCGPSVPIPVAGSVARLAVDPRIGIAMRRVLERYPCDILHIHEPFVPMTSFGALVFSKTVTVGTFHLTRERPHLLYFLAQPIVRPLVGKLHARIAVSEAARRTVAQFLPGEYRVIPNGIEQERFDRGPRPGPSRYRVLFLGRLEPRKGIIVAIRAFAEVAAALPGAELVVAGDGPLRAAAEKLARELGVADAVRFLGPLAEEELPDAYAEADVFCAPATGNESFGIVLAEAMAAGTPVVASGNPGYAAVVEPGVSGLLVPPGDHRALARAIVEVLRDPVLWRRLSEGGRLRARCFSWSALADDVLAVYQEAAHRAGRPLALLRTPAPAG